MRWKHFTYIGPGPQQGKKNPGALHTVPSFPGYTILSAPNGTRFVYFKATDRPQDEEPIGTAKSIEAAKKLAEKHAAARGGKRKKKPVKKKASRAKTGKLHVENKGRGKWAWSVRVGGKKIAEGVEPRRLAAENAARTAATKKAPSVTFSWNPHPPKGETCGPGKIRVNRRSYTRTTKEGKRVRVGASQFCITDQGTPGKTSFGAKGPGALRPGTKPLIKRKGSLGEGFLTSMTDKQREAAIRRALKHASYASVMGKLTVLELSEELKKKYGAKLRRAKDYLRSLHAKSKKKTSKKKKRGNPGVYEIPSLGTLEAFPKAVRMWEHVYESARDRGFSKQRSAQQAWAAVKNAGYHEDAVGQWHGPGGRTAAKPGAVKRSGRFVIRNPKRGTWTWSVVVSGKKIASGTATRKTAAENDARTAAAKKAPNVGFSWDYGAKKKTAKKKPKKSAKNTPKRKLPSSREQSRILDQIIAGKC